MGGEIDAKVFALISVGTLFAVAVLRKALPKWVVGKEEFLALILPVAFTVAAKALGAFKETDWVNALLWAVGAAMTAGVAYDKIASPTVEYAKSARAAGPEQDKAAEAAK